MLGLFTGISGVDKKPYLERVSEMVQATGRNSAVFHVGDEIISLADRSGFPVGTDKILDLPAGALAGFRAAVFEKILGLLSDQDSDDVLLINTHACFRWEDYLTSAFDLAYLRDLCERASSSGRDVRLFCVIDSLPDLWLRLQGSSQWKNRLTLTEIAVWQDEERFLTAMLAGVLGLEYHVLARAEPIQNAADLLVTPRLAKFYFSFPISSVAEEHRVEWKAEVESFRDAVREHVVVFDPLSIRDMEWLRGRYHNDIDPGDERSVLDRLLGAQTIGRDLQLIDQADGVVVCMSERAIAHSAGVQREIEHGHDTGKDVLVYFSGTVSPFLKYSSTAIFERPDELLQYLLSNHRTRSSD